ncbi:ribonuclease E inhibitor RraA/Dimethylmenaquinone methyltransferase [Schizophyllum amplum]|uniref:Ribonuclease E inhibitor RraA/Dimethylmenaquinone methyltransferase n=1 Tax=Schizophyllum amplum TaxID=97359 RepID=A0A550CXI5_9AGAR|nr:ribonuclease E inhibitor RraA/Dimethylmenaquinone methyltransferase [Auriculariopsis ampla]
MNPTASRMSSAFQAMSTTSHCSRLSELSTCEISDALIKLGVPHGGLLPDIHIVAPSQETKVCAPACTVKMVMGSNTSAPKLSGHFVDQAPAGSVIVIDAPLEAKNAVWGGLMSAGAQARGAVGVVISGRCRDLAEHRALGFPVFARGHSTLGQSPFTRPSEVNVPVYIKPVSNLTGSEDTFPAALVTPGDWVVGDEDGVVCVPRDMEEEVVVKALKGREVDDRCMQDIKAGRGVQASFKLHRGK